MKFDQRVSTSDCLLGEAPAKITNMPALDDGIAGTVIKLENACPRDRTFTLGCKRDIATSLTLVPAAAETYRIDVVTFYYTHLWHGYW